ncbi:lysozyme family protein [Candidatus Cetobacterium colombiensis]|uniref:Peptidoglycan-binding domain-containing protein n=1 Tax=Candidatus Cetobacterium colombiensis TaxID=3073100 RepID=A0ABU4W947_9FUSO|nr:putative peptidoglycan-binding domain-containing protein [Candidatus Cetobacterium colombiensis]MDX8336056.1 putative peptidoglycan-binding domain-containing protein [Candidatus Cetobacterium colombiensis]
MLEKFVIIITLLYSTAIFGVEESKVREIIISEVLSHEGDKLVKTQKEFSKYGIRNFILLEYNKKFNKNYEIKSLTETQAREIAEHLLVKYRLNEIKHSYSQMMIFDIFFNGGYNAGAVVTQRALKRYKPSENIEVDGVLGSKTIAVINSVQDHEKFIDLMTEERINYYKSLNSWSLYGKGWKKRILTYRTKLKEMAIVDNGNRI